MLSILAQTWVAILIVSIVVLIFIVVTVINLKTKRPKMYNDEDCNACDYASSCPIIVRRDKEKENSEQVHE
jgi:uncharacterized membrane protein